MPSGEQERRWTLRGRSHRALPNIAPFVFVWTTDALAHGQEIEVMPVSDHEAEVEKLKGERDASRERFWERDRQLLAKQREVDAVEALLAEARSKLDEAEIDLRDALDSFGEGGKDNLVLAHGNGALSKLMAIRSILDSTPTTEQGERIVAEDYKAQRDKLLKAINEHRAELAHGLTANSRLADERLHSLAARLRLLPESEEGGQ